ncbi:MAG: hypothetical protein QM739_01675 [Propionivibrio sp.]
MTVTGRYSAHDGSAIDPFPTFKEKRMKTLRAVLAVTSTLFLLIPPTVEAASRIRKSGVVANVDGGYTGGRFVAAHGANGGEYVRGHALRTDGAGNGTITGGSAFRGPNGARGARAGTTTRLADGGVAHQSAMAASGVKGSVESKGGFTRTDEGVTQSRTTTATGAGGASYQGSTSYDKDTGLTHSASCANAAGDGVPCR